MVSLKTAETVSNIKSKKLLDTLFICVIERVHGFDYFLEKVGKIMKITCTFTQKYLITNARNLSDFINKINYGKGNFNDFHSRISE